MSHIQVVDTCGLTTAKLLATAPSPSLEPGLKARYSPTILSSAHYAPDSMLNTSVSFGQAGAVALNW